LKAVFDTNVLVAAFATEGLCSKLLHRVNRKNFELFISPFILQEFTEALKKKFSLSPREIKEALGLLMEVAESIDPKYYGIEVSNVCRDKDDNQVLACAIACKAEYIVSGDKDLLALKIYNKIKIISPRAFELLFD
jgi:putative PIN family toxin of toxin-antitoxin system